MLDSHVLKNKLSAIDGQDYGSYQSLKGEYDFKTFQIVFEQIPKDPYAPPHTGIYRIRLRRKDEHVIQYQPESKLQQIAFRDFLARNFYQASETICKGRRGTGFSGIITINQPGQSILERSCVVMDDDFIEVRCFIGLPASGRNVKSNVARQMLFEEIPKIIESSLFRQSVDINHIHEHINGAEDAEYLRNQLSKKGLIAFIGDQSVLPRVSGSSQQPLGEEIAIPFVAPETLRFEFKLPHAGRIRGLGIPAGVTLIVGGGYHGKSTLLNAIELGIYNHIPGDGREKCVTVPETVKVRAYSGRYIAKTDISVFINNLPFDKDTTGFSTENASGSTSQAAGIIEAIEVGAKVLLMDEDTCATNFMIRDQKMQQLVHKNEEPIITYIDHVQQLYQENGISTVLVLGGVGDYFDVSDHVIQMLKYQPVDMTKRAKQIASGSSMKRKPENTGISFHLKNRIPIPTSINPLNEYGKKGINAREVHRLSFGKYEIDLTDLEQLCELSQTKAIGFAIEYAKRYMDQTTTLKEVVERVVEDICEKGLDIIHDRISPNFASFRSFELAFTLNRLRGFEVLQK